MRERIKWWVLPGMNLHARLRYRVLPSFLGSAEPGGHRLVLDAGCGNGMLAYQSHLRGNRVLGVSFHQSEVSRNRKLYNEFLGIPADKLSFRVHNLYEIESLGMTFDEIICTEVLEHIRRDAEVCRSFWNILKPGGTLHLCCPNALHPDNEHFELDLDETGGHVRQGYTGESYRALLEPIGFALSPALGLGGPWRQAANKRITGAQKKCGLLGGILVFALLGPLQIFDRPEPKIPLSLYIRATKPPLEPRSVGSTDQETRR